MYPVLPLPDRPWHNLQWAMRPAIEAYEGITLTLLEPDWSAIHTAPSDDEKEVNHWVEGEKVKFDLRRLDAFTFTPPELAKNQTKAVVYPWEKDWGMTQKKIIRVKVRKTTEANAEDTIVLVAGEFPRNWKLLGWIRDDPDQ